MLSQSQRQSLSFFIVKRWLVLGYLVLLTGLFWLPSGSVYTKVFYALIAFPALLALALKPRRCSDLLHEPMVLVFLVFSAWMLTTLAWSGTDDNFGGLVKRPLYLLLFMAACSLIALERRELLLGTLRTAAMLVAFAALVSLGWFLLEPPPENRLIGTGALRNPLLTSHVLGMFCTYWIATWLSRDTRQEWLAPLMTLPILLALLATGSRTPLMALVVTSLWMLLITPRRAALLILTIAVAGGLCLAFSPDLLLQRGGSFRPQIWADALRQAQDHLWLGHGYDNRFVFIIEGLSTILSDPHNVGLAVLLELGLVGLGFWLVLHGLGLWHCLRQRKDKAFQVASALVVYGLAAGMTEGSSFLSRPNESWFLIWIPLSLVIALAIQKRGLGKE